MTQTLPQVGHEHHERLLQHVNQMPEIADRLLTAKSDEFRRAIGEVREFLTGVLAPHVERAEETLYPELERMYQNRHSMTPMRREHAEVRRLTDDFTKLVDQIDAGQTSLGRTLAIRRVVFQLYALLKIHLAEEEIYLRIVDQGVATDVAEMLAAAMDHPGTRTT